MAILIAFGGLAFNIGNVAGAGLGLNVLFDIDVRIGATISAIIGIAIFLFKEFGKTLDVFVKILGFVMLALIVYVVFYSSPPLGEAVLRTVYPETISPTAIVTLVGGTVGGYITFAGAHRLIDAGISGEDALPEVNRGAVTGILLTAMIRFLLFLASFGVIALGMTIDDKNPPASVFQNAAGVVGYKIFGIVMWSAAITSVVGAAYTSVSFLKTFHRKLKFSQQISDYRLYRFFDLDIFYSSASRKSFGFGRNDQRFYFAGRFGFNSVGFAPLKNSRRLSSSVLAANRRVGWSF